MELCKPSIMHNICSVFVWISEVMIFMTYLLFKIALSTQMQRIEPLLFSKWLVQQIYCLMKLLFMVGLNDENN
jgi:hypothetical protein